MSEPTLSPPSPAEGVMALQWTWSSASPFTLWVARHGPIRVEVRREAGGWSVAMRYAVQGRDACSPGPMAATADAGRVEAERWVPMKLGDWLALGAVAAEAMKGAK